MDGIIIISLAAIVIQIILVVKIIRMSNDIRAMRRATFSGFRDRDAIKEYLLGNKSRAKELLTESYAEALAIGKYTPYSLAPIHAKYKHHFEIIGEEPPAHLAAIGKKSDIPDFQ